MQVQWFSQLLSVLIFCQKDSENSLKAMVLMVIFYYKKNTHMTTEQRNTCIETVWGVSKCKASIVLRMGHPPSINVRQYPWSITNQGSSCELWVQSFIATPWHRYDWLIVCLCGWPKVPTLSHVAVFLTCWLVPTLRLSGVTGPSLRFMWSTSASNEDIPIR